MTRELPKNPNTRQPYSDVSLELEVCLGYVTDYLGTAYKDMGDKERKMLDIRLQGLYRAVLRASAVLDPEPMTDAQWELAKVTAFELMIPLEEALWSER